MNNNISNAEAALTIAHEGQDLREGQQTAVATVAVAQAAVAVAKGVGVIAAVAYLAWRGTRQEKTLTAPVDIKLDAMIQKGLGL